MTRQLSWNARYALVALVTDVTRSGLHIWRKFSAGSGLQSATGLLRTMAIAIALTTAMTACLLGVTRFVELRHVSIAYLIPVLVAAISVGIAPAVAVSVCSIAAAAYFFYPPIWDLRIADPQHLLDVLLFIVVAMATGKLASSARSHAVRAEERERETRMLYAFSKHLAVATEEAHIYAAIEDHLSSMTGCPVIYFAPDAHSPARFGPDVPVPDAVKDGIRDLAHEPGVKTAVWVDDDRVGASWLVRPVSRTGAASGVVAVEIGRTPAHNRAFVQQRIDVALADAIETLERLDMARVIGITKLRTEAETLRTALIGSVSHGLRTPLASIMGSSSILVQAPAIARDPHLAALAGIVREEAEILNQDIQKLLDASQISSAGVRAHMDWADPADIVNSAVGRHAGRAGGHHITLQLPEELPLVYVDSVLIEQALSLIIDNAVRYSPAASTVRIEACRRDRSLAISVRDEGAGLSVDEQRQMFERFYRGPRTRETVSGSGLGLWIAKAFVAACGGEIEAVSAGEERGATVTILLFEVDATAENYTGGAHG